MGKTGIIIKREYLTRVTKKSFLLTTILIPIFFIAVMVLPSVMATMGSSEKMTIIVSDPSEMISDFNWEKGNLEVQYSTKEANDILPTIDNSEIDGVLYIKPLADNLAQNAEAVYYSDQKLGPDMSRFFSKKLAQNIKSYKVSVNNLDKTVVDALKTKVQITSAGITNDTEENNPYLTEIASGVGMFMGLLMYMFIFLYGMMVMKSVMEEKVNRIVEVIISSVKPFDLMLGKIVGVGLVALTQILIWTALISLGSIFASSFMETPEMESGFQQAMDGVFSLNWMFIIPVIVLFFIGGYILYAALFAAVGSAMGDDMSDQQSMTLPISIPVIAAMMIMMNVVRSPETFLAKWSSQVPFFSPIVMPARLAFDPPVWEVIISLIILYGTAFFMTWVAGRIYRVGILMYGKKGSFKEFFKWIID